MPINPNIILGVKPAQFQMADPLETAGKSLSLQHLMGQQDMQAMQMKQAQQAEADDLATREAFKAGGDRSEIVKRLMGSGQWKAAQAVEKAGLETRKSLADINKAELEGAAKRAEIYRNVMSGVRDDASYQAALQNPIVAAEVKDRGGAPATFDPQWQRTQVLTAEKFLDAVKPHITMVTSNGKQIPVDTNAWSNPDITKQTFSSADPGKDLVLPGPDGKYVPNAPLVAAKTGIARAGAANVSVNTANKPFLTEVGKGVGESVVGDFNAARNAVQTLSNAKQIEQGLSSVIAGPGASARVKLSQIGQVLGVTGADDAERLVNTRNVIQGLARQELAAAGQMKGQGQITESERGILRRAEAGQIAELTVPEIRALVSAVRKTANYKIGLHKSNMDRLKSDPNAAGVVDYMRVDIPTDTAPSVPPPAGFKPL